MLSRFFENIKGDKTIWAIIGALAIFSFLPVYSASTNLVYVAGKGSTLGYLLKHAILLLMGFVIVYATHKVPYRYFSGLSVLMMPVVILFLFIRSHKELLLTGQMPVDGLVFLSLELVFKPQP